MPIYFNFSNDRMRGVTILCQWFHPNHGNSGKPRSTFGWTTLGLVVHHFFLYNFVAIPFLGVVMARTKGLIKKWTFQSSLKALRQKIRPVLYPYPFSIYYIYKYIWGAGETITKCVVTKTKYTYINWYMR